MNSRNLLAVVALGTLLLSGGCHHRRPKEKAPRELVPVAVLYEKGQHALQKKRPASARRYFDQILLREDAGEYKEKAEIATADAYMADHTLDAYTEAISRYQAFLAFHPTHPEAPYCQFRIGMAYLESVETPDRDMSSAHSARDAFQALVDNYPKSPFVDQAREKLTVIDNLLAAHEIKVGDFYLKNGHPKGAVARYRGVVEKYPSYWNLPLVYYRLGRALAADGQATEASLYYKRVLETVPGTRLAKDAEKGLSSLDRTASRREKKDLPKEPLLPKEKRRSRWLFWKRG